MMESRLWTAIFGVGYFDVDGWPLPLLTPFRPFIAVVYRCGEPYDEDGREGSVELSLGMLAWHERFGDDGKNPTRLRSIAGVRSKTDGRRPSSKSPIRSGRCRIFIPDAPFRRFRNRARRWRESRPFL